MRPELIIVKVSRPSGVLRVSSVGTVVIEILLKRELILCLNRVIQNRVDTVSELSYGGSSDTETVREQCCDLEDYPEDTPEDHIENSIHQRLIEIMHEGAKGDIPTLRSRDITLVTNM